MPTCPGCDAWFSVGGYSSHLKQTRNPSCLTIRNAQESFGNFDDSDAEADNDNIVKPFEGDAFGAYDAADFEAERQGGEGGEVESEKFDSDDEEDEWGVGLGDDEDAENAAQEHAWEPPLPDDAEDERMDEMEDEDGGEGAQGNREESPEYNTDVPLIDKGAKPFVVNYPDPRAGTPTTDERRHSGWERYRSELEGGGPWVSKLDWEFARWAQLRGPGATSLTELLKIDGVRLHAYMDVCDETHGCCYSFETH